MKKSKTAIVLKTNKINGVWTFVDTARNILEGEFCNGSDVILDRYAIDNSCYILFSDMEIPEQGISKMKTEMEIKNKVYYTTIVDKREMIVMYYKKVLRAYFREIPETIYYKIYSK